RMRLDAAIAGWVQEMNEPISKAQDSAAQIDDLEIRIEPGRQQIDEVLPAALFKIPDGNAEKGLRAQDFGLLLQLHWTTPTGCRTPPAAGKGGRRLSMKSLPLTNQDAGSKTKRPRPC